MYELSICALFKNESHGMKEWLEHYIFHGAEHFYLLDDESDDTTREVIQPYIEKHIVTWIPVKWERYLGRQKDIYTHYILPRIHETKEHFMKKCARGDADEFKTLAIADFAEFDINEIEDLRLYEQNKGMIPNIYI